MMYRKTIIQVVLGILVLVICSGFVLKLEESKQSSLAAKGALALNASHKIIVITNSPAWVKVLLTLLVVLFVTLAIAPLLLEGQDTGTAGIM